MSNTNRTTTRTVKAEEKELEVESNTRWDSFTRLSKRNRKSGV
jgi:hypothetical protein